MAEIVNGATATIAVEDSAVVEKKGSPVKRKSEADAESPIKKAMKKDNAAEPQQPAMEDPVAPEIDDKAAAEQCDESKTVDGDAAAAGDKEEPQEPPTACDAPKSDAGTEDAKCDGPAEESGAVSADQAVEAEATA